MRDYLGSQIPHPVPPPAHARFGVQPDSVSANLPLPPAQTELPLPLSLGCRDTDFAFDPPHDFSPFDPVLGTLRDFNSLLIRVTLAPSLMLNRIHHIGNTAMELASQFAFCKAEEEKTEEVEADDSMPLANEAEDWLGPFCTAMKVIEERELIPRARRFICTSVKDGEAEVKIPWMPSNVWRHMTVGKIIPPLKDLCSKVLCEDSKEIESLEGLTDAVKHNIGLMLCHSRRTSSHFLGLLTKGSPLEIYLSDCSWATDKLFEEVLSQCNIDNLKVFQLGVCGRCLLDYVLHSTFAKAPECLPLLNRLSINVAFCLSNGGLDTIVASASLLMPLNLSQCPLITSKGILALADKLEADLIDVCHNMDAMFILPVLKKLKCLDVIFVAHMKTVTDKILKHLIPIPDPKLRMFIIAGCRKLTNASMKVIGESCHHLSFLDIRYLEWLNDSAIQHLVNGGCPFQRINLCHDAFNDEALVALLEVSCATLVERVLNNIEGNTYLAIYHSCLKLLAMGQFLVLIDAGSLGPWIR